MRVRHLALALVATTACGILSIDPSGEGRGVLGAWVMSNGLQRTYTLHLPAAYSRSRAWPLLILLHGAGDTGHDFEQRIGMGPLTDSAGVIAVYPDGVDSSWGSGCHCTEADILKVDDVRFMRTLVKTLSDSLDVDMTHVYVGGYSQGAMMTERLVCDMSDMLAGAISVAATLPSDIANACHPERPVPMVFFQGTADTTFKWGGMQRDGEYFYSVAATVGFYAQEDGCGDVPPAGADSTSSAGDSPVAVDQFGRCDTGSVTLVAIDGGGHNWPGSPGPWPASLGIVSQSVDASRETLRFIQRNGGFGAP